MLRRFFQKRLRGNPLRPRSSISPRVLRRLDKVARRLPAGLRARLVAMFESNVPGFNIIFDADHYQALTSANGHMGYRALVHHYIRHGRRMGISPHPLFDHEHYLKQAPEARNFAFSPIVHFLVIGRRKSISPTPLFDFDYYRQNNPDVIKAKVCPYLYWVKYGYAEGRVACPGDDHHGFLPRQENTDPSATASPPDADKLLVQLRSMEPLPSHREAVVDVIMPVYGNRPHTLQALQSVLASRCETPYRLIVIDDASPDEQLSRELKELASRLGFLLISHDENRGFVHSVNEGMQQSATADVVLLNSDTQVFGNWLDRLRKAACSRPDIATVTPFTNNGTICSYPRFLHATPHPLELSWQELDALAAEMLAGRTISIPTAVGFCMYIRREALVRVGYFDAEAFGRGYGEENDFCRRAVAAGMDNVMALDTFVWHSGGESFGEDKWQLMQKGLRTLTARFPEYQVIINHFITTDPLAPARARLDMARLLRQKRKRNILIATHNRGGGTEACVVEDVDEARKKEEGVFFLRPAEEGGGLVRLSSPGIFTPNLPALDLGEDAEILARILKELAISLVRVHHLIDLSDKAPGRLAGILTAAGIPYEVILHDYFAIDPLVNMADEKGVVIDPLSPERCNERLRKAKGPYSSVDCHAWREAWRGFLMGARKVSAPSMDVVRRFRRYFPALRVVCEPHEPPRDGRIHLPVRNRKDAPWHICVLGAISRIKGYDVLLSCARHARCHGLPVKFSVIGYTANDAALRKQGVDISGPYTDSKLPELLQGIEPDCIFLPSAWPETYSFTLSHALQSGRPIIVFDVGAMAERTQGLKHCLRLPLELHDKPKQLMEQVLSWLENLYEQRDALHGQPFTEARLSLDLNKFYQIMNNVQPAHVNYLVFFTARSGSTYLTNLLHSTACLGEPGEFFNPKWFERIREYLGAPDLLGVVEALRHRKKSPKGVFGAEITYHQYAKILETHGDILDCFPGQTRHFFLFRRDLVKQAISLYKAAQTKIYHSTQIEEGGVYVEREKELRYDADEIMKWLKNLYRQESDALHVFRQKGIYPVVLSYERLTSLPPEAVADFFRKKLGLEKLAGCRPPDPAIKRLATALNKEFHERFMQEHGHEISRLMERRSHLFEKEEL